MEGSTPSRLGLWVAPAAAVLSFGLAEFTVLWTHWAFPAAVAAAVLPGYLLRRPGPLLAWAACAAIGGGVFYSVLFTRAEFSELTTRAEIVGGFVLGVAFTAPGVAAVVVARFAAPPLLARIRGASRARLPRGN